MNFRLSRRLRHGGLSSVTRRFAEILAGYGFSEGKFEGKLSEYQSVLEKHGVHASFAATAIAVARNPQVFKRLAGDGVELMVQAYRHIDYSRITEEKQREDVEKSVKVFKDYGLDFTGFRAPYLKYSPKTHGILKNYFKYNSGERFLWECALPIKHKVNSESFISVPYYRSNLLEIPVSLPSDIWLLHRVGVKDQREISDIWINALECSHIRGELFTLQLHPENIMRCHEALDALLSFAEGKAPPVWISRLSDVADWWVRREKYSLSFDGAGMQVSCDCGDDATVVVKDLEAAGSKNWFADLKTVEARKFKVKKNPAVGVAPAASEELKKFLSTEGFIVEESTAKNDYGLYFEAGEFTEEDKLSILREIGSSGKPYARLWRWPNANRSALSISGDIDCVTLWDYVLRVLGK
ncbi:MAG: polysaccharide deacetylase family protein [Candidatus Altiarchaeota archaeon]